MAEAPIDVDGLIKVIQRSSLQTVLVEGSTDASVYRDIQAALFGPMVDFVSCGGRGPLLEVFARRNEFADKPVAFVADLDSFVLLGVPRELGGVIFTTGYSIENDLYCSGIVEKMFSTKEARDFSDLLSTLSQWMAFETLEKSAGRDGHFAENLESFADQQTQQLTDRWRAKRHYISPDENLVVFIRENYRHFIPGKQLFSAAVRFLSHSKRRSKFSKENLREMSIKQGLSEELARLQVEIQARLA